MRALDLRISRLIESLAEALAYIRECRDLAALPGGKETVKDLARFAIGGAALIDEYLKRNLNGFGKRYNTLRFDL